MISAVLAVEHPEAAIFAAIFGMPHHPGTNFKTEIYFLRMYFLV
jgi:hypothetical protein